jgi:hypothetical protein
MTVRSDATREWWLPASALLHRYDGPAIERPNGRREWWLDGERVDEKTGASPSSRFWRVGTVMSQRHPTGQRQALARARRDVDEREAEHGRIELGAHAERQSEHRVGVADVGVGQDGDSRRRRAFGDNAPEKVNALGRVAVRAGEDESVDLLEDPQLLRDRSNRRPRAGDGASSDVSRKRMVPLWLGRLQHRRFVAEPGGA